MISIYFSSILWKLFLIIAKIISKVLSNDNVYGFQMNKDKWNAKPIMM